MGRKSLLGTSLKNPSCVAYSGRRLARVEQLGLAMTGVTIGYVLPPSPFPSPKSNPNPNHPNFISYSLLPRAQLLSRPTHRRRPLLKTRLPRPLHILSRLTAFDFLCRAWVVEKADAVRWDELQPASMPGPVSDPASLENVEEGSRADAKNTPTASSPPKLQPPPSEPKPKEKAKITQYHILTLLIRSPRVATALFNTLVFGVIMTSQEPTLPLRLNEVGDLRV